MSHALRRDFMLVQWTPVEGDEERLRRRVKREGAGESKQEDGRSCWTNLIFSINYEMVKNVSFRVFFSPITSRLRLPTVCSRGDESVSELWKAVRRSEVQETVIKVFFDGKENDKDSENDDDEEEEEQGRHRWVRTSGSSVCCCM